MGSVDGLFPDHAGRREWEWRRRRTGALQRFGRDCMLWVTIGQCGWIDGEVKWWKSEGGDIASSCLIRARTALAGGIQSKTTVRKTGR